MPKNCNDYSVDIQKCKVCGRRVAWTGIWVSFALTILKFVIGYTSGSKALIADGLHSASNIITAMAILVSQNLIRQKESNKFAYGYGKVEFLTAGFVSLLVIIGAVLLIVISIKHLLHEQSVPPHLTALLVAVISIACNEMMFRYMKCAATRLNSQAIMATAWANRADCFSSVAVMLGVIGSRFAISHLDPIAALFVVGVIVKINSSILMDSVRSLMDVSVNDIYSDDIKDIVREVEGVEGLSALKTRQVGHYVWAEVDIQVEPLHCMGNAHTIGQRVKDTLLKKIKDLEKVTVHVSPLKVAESDG